MIYDLGLQDALVGVTFECPSDKPRIVRSRLEGMSLDSAAIDALVSEAAAQGQSLYQVDQPLLEAADPDVIFTQHVCDVCQIGTSYVEQAVYALAQRRASPPRIVPLVPRRLEDVFGNALTIARELGSPARGEALVCEAEARLDAIVDVLRAHRAPPRRVLVMEWLDPIYNCGHWIPDQIVAAGGADALSCPAGYSVPLPWEKVRLYDPEVLVLAPCGFDVARARQDLPRLEALPGFRELSAVREGRAFVSSAVFFTQPSLLQLITGVELLASFFHPTLFKAPAAANSAWEPFRL
jgi:iron complex transport system substrate-binding protein